MPNPQSHMAWTVLSAEQLRSWSAVASAVSSLHVKMGTETVEDGWKYILSLERIPDPSKADEAPQPDPSVP